MCKIVLNVVSPSGMPLSLHLSPEDEGEAVKSLLEKTEKLGQWLAAKGWEFGGAAPSVPTAAELASGPTFCGYPCSPTVDDRGLPSWIIVNERQATRREKQGDVWYSYKNDAGEYEHVLRIPKGEKAPAVVGLPK